MADWLDDEISGWDAGSPSKDPSTLGCFIPLILIVVGFVIIRFILPMFGIEFDPFNLDFDALFG